MIKELKKYWFVALIVCFLLGICGYYAYDVNKGKLPGKKVNGEDVVFSVGEQDTTANQFYDDLYANAGSQQVANMIVQSVVSQSVETTDEMKTNAASSASSVISNYISNYGSADYETQLLTDIRSMGYSSIDDLNEIMINQYKEISLVEEYVKANWDEYKPREVSHILITCADPDNPTKEEKAKMDEVDKALADGQAFSDVATNYSDDTGSAANGGNLGVMDKNTSYVPEFLEAALALNDGETSEWTKSTYGYHLITVSNTTPETLEAAYPDTLYSSLSSTDNTLLTSSIWNKAQEIGIDFHGDTDLETSVKTYLGITE